jgi:hypothetical protein
MGQAGAVMIALMRHENLRLVLEPPERRRMNNAIAIAAKCAAGSAILFRIKPAARTSRIGRK